ncbi:hypothetical protein TDB9533_00817 [Thalassocella blandensis]|nr:hypothetical protein TDB9533_00817 [Thalassocella blandensis]
MFLLGLKSIRMIEQSFEKKPRGQRPRRAAGGIASRCNLARFGRVAQGLKVKFVIVILLFLPFKVMAYWTYYQNNSGCAPQATLDYRIAVVTQQGALYRVTACGEGGTLEVWIGNENPCSLGQEWSNANQECGAIDISADNCVETILSNGGNGIHKINSDGTVECIIGMTDQDGNPLCTTEAGQACYTTTDNAPENSNCGTFNGQAICVSSIGGQGTGTSDSEIGESTVTSPESISFEEIQNTDGTTTTIETTSTTSTTTNTQPLLGEMPLDGELDPGSKAAPFDCGNGQFISPDYTCDTAQVCPAGTYNDWGICVNMPTYTTVNQQTDKETTTIVRDSTTGEVISETTSNSSQQTPITGNGNPNRPQQQKVEVEFKFEGECDPSEKNYYDCVDVELQDFSEHTQTDATTFAEANINFKDRIVASDTVQAFENMKNLVRVDNGICPQFSIDLSNTLIKQTISTTIHCSLMNDIKPYLSAVMIVIYIFTGFRIFASA